MRNFQTPGVPNPNLKCGGGDGGGAHTRRVSNLNPKNERSMAAGGEVLTPPEFATEEMVPPEAEILGMEIASLVNLLREKQSEVLSLDPGTVRKIRSLRSEIACQKKEVMADQVSMDPPNSGTQMQGESSAETHASRMMDQGKKSSFRMVLDCDEKGRPNLCKYYEMLECESAKEEDEEMTAEGVRMRNKFRKELLEMELGLRKFREQNQKDALRCEQDQIDTPSCYTMDVTPFSLQDEAEEIEEAEETESTKSDREEIEMEDKMFALERKGWESAWGDDCGDFQDRTLLSPMLFTHCTPGLIPYAARTVSTLQIYSVKIVGTDGKLKLPLNVYGIVAARDAVDYNRNILFSRRRENCQKVTPEDPFLRLTGPSRAIVAVDHVDFEVQLKVKGLSRSRDRALISHCFTYAGGYNEGLHTTFFSNCFCTVELSYERLTETVQATILSARVVEGTPWPFKYGGRIMCSSPPQEVTDSLARQVVLVDSHCSDDGGEMPMGSDGYLDLSRHVVSVELEESLQFVIQAYSQSGDAIARQGSVKFRTKYCNISQAICEIGDSKVEITVAWSQLLKNKGDILFEGHV
ncbi:uncharacterized protein LOC123430495 [Hordeum vulgare subsp. vulgare]|uniref:DUF6598 domain-containing protein n=1 Tax=Hordeum vulgare subsp. vulgare TaxID=112509 RepID=A0A8I6XMK5_HORVV|nr:uncharacterized protein LOC123430495 [Hordeum vulgare subsp. vulgare]